jgi:nicotinate-nucleotide--dimethylbenzimidazole phosphoribosyltransferase
LTADRESQLSRLIDDVDPLDESADDPYWARLDSLTKPPRSLGRLEEMAVRVARIQQTTSPDVSRKTLILAAGDHGVAEEGVSLYPQEVTAQMVANFADGGAAINQIAAVNRVKLVVTDVGVASQSCDWPGVVDLRVSPGTQNILRGPAMTRDQCAVAVAAGAGLAHEAIADGAQLLGVGEMGIGNSTAAAAITAALTGSTPSKVVGPGTGLDSDAVRRKSTVVEKAIAVNDVDREDPFGVLAALGGLEIAALAGVIVTAAAERTPVVLDGYISGSAALAAVALCPRCAGYLLASHRSPEPGHSVVLEALQIEPILDLGMRLGEGTGAALAMGLIESGCQVMSSMATFDEAGVSTRAEGGVGR